MKKLISIVIPFYNEEENVNELYKRLNLLTKQEKKYDFEIITVEHGSLDTTFDKLLSLNNRDKRIKILQLSKNFGNADAGIAAGLAFVKYIESTLRKDIVVASALILFSFVIILA